ncbi:MAG: beta-propeller domain-containing protein [Planctomycetota bacterium]
MSGNPLLFGRLTEVAPAFNGRRPPAGFACLAVVMVTAALVTLSGCPSTGGSSGGEGAGDAGSQPPDDEFPERDDAAREIEEADIVKYQDGYFYLANRYRGLRIIDGRTIERPAIVGGVSMKGRGVELYVEDDRAFVVSSADYYTCAGEPVSFADAETAEGFLFPDYTGSRITAVDVGDPSDPFEISHFDMDGFTVATRRVGEVIYAVGNYVGIPQTPADGDQEEPDGTGDDSDPDAGPADGDGESPPPPSSTGEAAIVDETGTASASATSPGGFLAEVNVTGAEQGRFVQVTAADGNLRGLTEGLPEDLLLPTTVRVNSDLEGQAFTAVIALWPEREDLEALELSTFDLGVYRFDESLDRWLPAATNDAGQAEPTDTVGDFGYHDLIEGGGLAIWAVVDRLGDFAMGLVVDDELTVEIIESSGGTVQLDPDQETYVFGTVLTLTAVPEEGFRFVEWSPAPPTSDPVTAESIQVTLTENQQVGAVFAPFTPEDLGPHVFVVSINIADPDDIHIVDRVAVTGDSLDIQVTQNAIYVLGDDPNAERDLRSGRRPHHGRHDAGDLRGHKRPGW